MQLLNFQEHKTLAVRSVHNVFGDIVEYINKHLPSEVGLETMTIDTCQGSEFDYVILNTVRAKKGVNSDILRIHGDCVWQYP